MGALVAYLDCLRVCVCVLAYVGVGARERYGDVTVWIGQWLERERGLISNCSRGVMGLNFDCASWTSSLFRHFPPPPLLNYSYSTTHSRPSFTIPPPVIQVHVECSVRN